MYLSQSVTGKFAGGSTINFVVDLVVRSIRTEFSDLRSCEDNTSKNPFSQCENIRNLQGIHVQVKSEYVGTLTTSELVTRMQSDKHNNMFNVAANLKHVETDEDTN